MRLKSERKRGSIIKKNKCRENKKPELLAPAGDMESVMAAINAGADALYFGGVDFNARHGAKNLSQDEMRQIVKISKAYQIKNYLVLNTLIKDTEWQALIDDLNFYQTLNLNGLIVQDLGLIYLLQKHYNFPLQTSTQMSVYGLEGVLFFEDLGFDRVVCPREMSLEEVASIKAASKIPLKIFVHGALCYAYSGQCLLSSTIGGRSGNRGRCAQPCRKNYGLRSEAGKLIDRGFLLSPKDLKTHDHLQAIIASGVDALKIEGRMKTPEYVFAVSRAYREGIDAFFSESKKAPSISERELMQVFNRDFTGGHLMKDADSLNPQLGKNRGIKIGKVGSIEPKKSGYYNLPLLIDRDVIIAIGDGLSFGEDGKDGGRVDRIFSIDGKALATSEGHREIKIPYKGLVSSGTVVFRNRDSKLMEGLKKEALASLPLEKSRLDLEVQILKDQVVTVQVSDFQKTILYKSEIYPQQAKKNPLNEAMISKQFRRLGDTDFELGELIITCQAGLFLAKSQLNALRSESLKVFENYGKLPEPKIDLATELKSDSSKALDCLNPKVLSVEFANLPEDSQLEELALKNHKAISLEWVFPLELSGQDDGVFEKIKKWRGLGISIKIVLPRIMNEEMVKHLKLLRDAGKLGQSDGLIISNYEGLYCLKDQGISLEANASFNVFNCLALKTLRKWGLDVAVLSLELEKEAIVKMGEAAILPLTLAVYGYQEVMVSKKCILNCSDCFEKNENQSCRKTFKGYLEDQQKFPVRRDERGLIHLYTESPLFLSDEVFNLKGVKTLRIYHYDESTRELNGLVDYYMKRMMNQEIQVPKGNWGRFKRGVK